MENAAEPALRPLGAGDLERVVDIDRRLVGHSRRGFFDKRLAAAEADPASFIALAVEQDGTLVGFAIARLQAGEFGEEHPVAILDAIGVDPDRQGRGLGRMLMSGLEDGMRRLGLGEIRTQADWTYQPLIRFFAAAGFSPAPRLALERPATGGLDS